MKTQPKITTIWSTVNQGEKQFFVKREWDEEVEVTVSGKKKTSGRDSMIGKSRSSREEWTLTSVQTRHHEEVEEVSKDVCRALVNTLEAAGVLSMQPNLENKTFVAYVVEAENA